jgi:inosine-uridine nucleoside N-ribohydrolase
MKNSPGTINLILDTDIGPDCDDAGALTLLHLLARKKTIQFLAMTNCTSNPYAAGTIDAINRYYGRPEIPVGTYEKGGFLEDGFAQKYNKFITLNYANRFVPPSAAPGALPVLKKALAGVEDGSAVILAIGPLNNLAALVSDDEGLELIKGKSKLLVSMAMALDPGKAEWNTEQDIKAAAKVCEAWPGPVVFSPMETGAPIITGRNFGTMKSDHPVRAAYRLFNNGDENAGRNSWDLTAAWYAVMGEEPFFSLSEFYELRIDEKGRTQKKPASEGRFRFLLNRMNPHEIAKQIDAFWSA